MAAAAAAAAAAGGLIRLPPPQSAAPRFGASRAPPLRWRRPGNQRRPRRHGLGRLFARSAAVEEAAYAEPEAALLEALLGVQGRGRAVAPRQLQEVESAVQALEALGGVPDPTSSSLIEGSWQLIFTTRPGTASPIQRTFVGVDSFRIFQEVYLRTDDPRVINVVRFSESVGDLKVEAEATVEDGKRILFRFDRAAFTFKFLPFKVPYPVPFRLLGDEAKGWLDTTYLSHAGNIRISRGNKKSADARQILLSTISAGTGVEEVIGDFISSQNVAEFDLDILVGEWQLLWRSKTEGESWSSVASAGLKDFQIIKEDGQLKNSVSSFPGVNLSARGNIWYIDNKIRISRINQHLLVHLRVANAT
ncbi:unnamed protein product [Urochloa decumbens]|uniref:Plastid lipid-associated protein/fibrillin conserved domain-containing protein n=1 Tax=Urochloa decumbens TaxID=240449 RepID=A0ABC9FCE8_9POAL